MSFKQFVIDYKRMVTSSAYFDSFLKSKEIYSRYEKSLPYSVHSKTAWAVVGDGIFVDNLSCKTCGQVRN